MGADLNLRARIRPVLAERQADSVSNNPSPDIQVVNSGGTSIPLADLEARYYFVADNLHGQTQILDVDWASIGAGNVQGSFVHLAGLSKILLRWNVTVRSLKCNCPAISLLRNPLVNTRTTSRSRRLKVSVPLPGQHCEPLTRRETCYPTRWLRDGAQSYAYRIGAVWQCRASPATGPTRCAGCSCPSVCARSSCCASACATGARAA